MSQQFLVTNLLDFQYNRHTNKGDNMIEVATISFIDSAITPIEVEFPNSIGHYRTLDDAMVDIRLFGCIPSFRSAV